MQNTKDRLDTIRDVIKDESELHFRLTRPPKSDAIGENVADDSMEQNAEIRFSDDDNRQFIDFAFADATDTDQMRENIGNNENESNDNAAQTYLNSLFAAVGYRRITTPPPPLPTSIESEETTSGNIIAKYLINPLVSAWNSTRERFSWNASTMHSNENDDGDEDSAKSISSSDATDSQTMLFRINFFDNRDDIKPNTHTNSTNKDPNESRVDNFNYSLPLIQLTPNNVTDDMLTNETMTLQENANKANVSQTTLDVDYIGDDHSTTDTKKPRDTVTTRSSSSHSVEDAVNAFRNAFLKYSNDMHSSTENAKFDTSTKENVKFTRNNSLAMMSDKLLLLDNLFETNSSHIQVVPSKKLKTNASISENVTIANDVDNSIELPAKSFGENAGILILEIFGTVIGMTWRAVSGIPNYFNAARHSNQH